MFANSRTEQNVRTTSAKPLTSSAVATSAQAYGALGWNVTGTANGVSLITDETICAIEVTGELVDGVREYMRANRMTGPVIEIPGTERREIHLATGVAKASMAIEALRARGAIVHLDGAGVPLPPTQLTKGTARWIVAPEAARWIPPVVALGAAVRAAATRTARKAAERAAS